MGTIWIFSIWWFLFIFSVKWQRWCKVLCLINCNHENNFFFYFFFFFTLTWIKNIPLVNNLCISFLKLLISLIELKNSHYKNTGVILKYFNLYSRSRKHRMRITKISLHCILKQAEFCNQPWCFVIHYRNNDIYPGLK